MIEEQAARHAAEYHDQGFTVLHDVFSPEEVETLKSIALRLEEHAAAQADTPPPHGECAVQPGLEATPSDFAFRDFGHSLAMMYASHVYPQMQETVRTSRLPSLVAELIGSRSLRYYFDEVHIKRPNSDNATPYHHDLASLPFTGSQIPICWSSFTPYRADAAPLSLIPGSHLLPTLFYPSQRGKGAEIPGYSPLPTLEEFADRYGLTLQVPESGPGDCIVFHPRTVHGAPPNRSQETRIGFVCRWIGEDAVYRANAMSLPEPRLRGAPMTEERFERLYPICWTAGAGAGACAPPLRAPVG